MAPSRQGSEREQADEACRDGLRRADDEDNNEIRGWTDKNTMIK